METYWRKYAYDNMDNLVPYQEYLIKEDDKILVIQPSNLSIDPSHRYMSSKMLNVVLKEVPKEEVIEALKSTINRLNLPKEINILNHKF